MSQPIRGKLEIQTNDGVTTITLDGNDARITVVRDSSRNERLKFDADTGNLDLGGIGLSGALRVQDNSGNNRIWLQGQRGMIIIHDSSGNELLNFEGSIQYLGGTNSSGHLVFLDRNRKDRIRLNGETGDILVKDSSGNELLKFEAQYALLTLGGVNQEGDLIIRDKSAKERIFLHGEQGYFFIKDPSGNERLAFWAENADLALGGPNLGGGLFIRGPESDRIHLNGKTGNIHIYNSTGTEKIRIEGDTGDIILQGADCAEEFDVEGLEESAPGTVLVIDEDGKLRPCEKPYDKKVAGVASGGNGSNPGIVLDKRPTGNKRLPIALNGKVYCKVDAQYSTIDVGDLLTTSPTPGHAMKANNPSKAFGAVIGKAMHPLREGKGLIPILVALQ